MKAGPAAKVVPAARHGPLQRLDPLQELDPLQRYPLPKSDLLHVAYAMLFKCLFCGHSDEEQSAYLSLFMDIAQGR